MRKQSGFTLLEVLLAIALASLVLASIYGIFSSASAAKEKVEKQGAALHLGRVLITRLDRELLGLALDNRQGQAALEGGKNSLGEPYLKLLTNSSGSPQPGIHRIQYRLGPGIDDRPTLWRAEQSQNSHVALKEERLAQGIAQLTFSFYNGQNWQKSWNSLTDGRPLLVQAEIQLEGLPDLPPLQGVFDLPQIRGHR